MNKQDTTLAPSEWTNDQLKKLNIFELMVLATDGLTLHAGGTKASDQLLDNLGISSNDHVLEVGCGNGKGLCNLVDKYHCTAAGVDYYDLIVNLAKRRVQKSGLGDKINITRGDITKLHFSDGEFDVVLAKGVMDTISDKKAAASEIFRVLKTGGRFGGVEWRWLHEPDTQLLAKLDKMWGVNFSPMKSEDWVSLFESVGFKTTYVSLIDETGLPVGLRGVMRQDGFRQAVRLLGMMFMLVEWRPMRELWQRTNSLEYVRWMSESGALGYGIYAYKKNAS